VPRGRSEGQTIACTLAIPLYATSTPVRPPLPFLPSRPVCSPCSTLFLAAACATTPPRRVARQAVGPAPLYHHLARRAPPPPRKRGHQLNGAKWMPRRIDAPAVVGLPQRRQPDPAQRPAARTILKHAIRPLPGPGCWMCRFGWSYLHTWRPPRCRRWQMHACHRRTRCVQAAPGKAPPRRKLRRATGRAPGPIKERAKEYLGRAHRVEEQNKPPNSSRIVVARQITGSGINIMTLPAGRPAWKPPRALGFTVSPQGRPPPARRPRQNEENSPVVL
jgi:hypothetical protein